MKIQKALIAVIIVLAIGLTNCNANNLAGTEWILGAMNGISMVDGTSLTIQFGSDGKISGSSGCNTFGGDYSISGDTLNFQKLFMTEMACLKVGVMQQEQAYQSSLGQVYKYALKDNQLILMDVKGSTLLVYNRK